MKARTVPATRGLPAHIVGIDKGLTLVAAPKALLGNRNTFKSRKVTMLVPQSW